MRSRVRRVGTVVRTTGIAGLVLALALGLPVAEVRGQPALDADATRILRSMSSYLGHLKAFSVDVDVDTEVIDRSGQKLQFSSSGRVIAQRPSRLYASRTGGFADAALYFDGKTVTVYGKNRNIYLQVQRTGTIDDAIDAVRGELGLDLGGADLLYADPYPGLLTDVMSGADYGTGVVEGVVCDHLAFRAAAVDWQIWVRRGDRPVPMKYVITSKWVTGAPQYSVRMRNWDVNPTIDGNRFTFMPPPGSKKVASVPMNVIGEIAGEGQK